MNYTFLYFACSLQVRIVLEGVDKYSNLIGSVYYSDGESAKDLAMELIENVRYINSREHLFPPSHEQSRVCLDI